MGFATKRVKVRRHNRFMRLKAATILVGCDYQQWTLPTPTGPSIHGYEVAMPDGNDRHYWPYGRTIQSAVQQAATQLGIE